MAATDLQLYGAGGHGKVVAEAWQLTGGRVIRVIDDSPSGNFLGMPVFGANQIDSSLLTIISIGSNLVRRRIAATYPDVNFGAVIHPSALISPSAIIGQGTLVMAGSTINSDSRVGNHSIINTGAIVEHDCIVGSFAHVGPGVVVCGEAVVGDGALIGANATILPGVEIGADCIVGAGSVVRFAIPANTVVVGNPAKLIR